MSMPSPSTSLDVDTAARLRVVLGRLARRLRPTAAGVAAGLTPTRSAVLLAVVRDGPSRLSELAAAEGINPTMLSRVISELVAGGLLERLSDEGDRRAAWVKATAAGRRLAERMRSERTDALKTALKMLSDGERRALEQALPALEELAEQLKAPPRVTRVSNAGKITFAALSRPQLPPLLRRSGDLDDRHVDADDRPGVAGADAHPLEHRARRRSSALQTLPVLLLGPYGGVIADRVDKRRLMIALQSAMGVQALVLGLLTVTGGVRVWEIGVLAALLGSTTRSRTRRASRSCSRWSAPSICATRSASTRCWSTSRARSGRRSPAS